MGTEEDKKEVKIGVDLEHSVKKRLIQMLHDYVEIFSWSYEDMTGLDTDIMVHRLPMKEGCSPIKQKICCMRPEMSEKIKVEVMKQFNAGLLAVTSYPQWVSNVILVLLYPKICPPIFFKDLPSQASKFPKGCTVQRSPIQSRLGFLF